MVRDLLLRSSAIICLASAYAAAVTSFPPLWVVTAAVAAFPLAWSPAHWAPTPSPGSTSALPRLGTKRVLGSLLPGWLLMSASAAGKFFPIAGFVVDSIWAIGVSMLLVGAWRLSHGEDAAAVGRADARTWAVGVAVVAFAAATRFWELDSVPRYVHLDEGVMAIDAARVYRDSTDGLIAPGPAAYYGLMRAYYYLVGAGNAAIGFSLFSTRLPDAVLGVLSVALAFDGVRRLSNLPTAAIAASLLAANHCHLAFSRIGAGYIQTAFVVALVVALFSRVWTRPSYFTASLLAIALALGVQTYQASAAALPLLLAVWSLALLVSPDRRRGAFPAAAVFAVSLCTAVAPFAAVVWQEADVLTTRSRQLSVIGNAEKIRWLAANVYHTDSSAMVAAGLIGDALRSFHRGRDRSEQYRASTPMADRYTAAMMIPGTVMVALALRRPLALAAVVFTICYLLSFATVWPPGFQRATGVLPMAMVLPAIAAVQCLGVFWSGGGQARRRAWAVSLALLTIVCAGAGLHVYFVEHPLSVRRGDTASEAGWAARTHSADYAVHLVSWPLGRTATGDPEPGWEGLRMIVIDVPIREHRQLDPVAYAHNAAVGDKDVFIISGGHPAARDALLARFPGARTAWWRRNVIGEEVILVFVASPNESPD